MKPNQRRKKTTKEMSQFGSEWLVGLHAATLTKISATKKINPPTDTARTERKKAKK